MEVFDWDMVGSDDFIGMISEPLLSAQNESLRRSSGRFW